MECGEMRIKLYYSDGIDYITDVLKGRSGAKNKDCWKNLSDLISPLVTETHLRPSEMISF